ncbi:hypothetical protein DYQ86_16105 [Acidobacteria bacterium AB60]|nr:hypothetical protein DYQ86_16105 [Acidobacteria bacterium AB60]
MRALALVLLALAVPAFAQNSERTTTVDVGLYVATLAAHEADYALIHHCMEAGTCREVVFPRAISQNPAAFVGVETLMSAGQVVISRRLKRHHPKMARAFDIVNLAAFGGMDAYLGTLQP